MNRMFAIIVLVLAVSIFIVQNIKHGKTDYIRTAYSLLIFITALCIGLCIDFK